MGIFIPMENPLVKEVPTRREPNKPGPRVKAIAEMESLLTPASSIA